MITIVNDVIDRYYRARYSTTKIENKTFYFNKINIFTIYGSYTTPVIRSFTQLITQLNKYLFYI